MTIGYTIIGGNGDNGGGAEEYYFSSGPFTVTSLTEGIIISGSFYVAGGSGTAKTRLLVFPDGVVAGRPDGQNPIATSDEVVLGSGAAASWVNFNFSDGQSVSNGQLVHIAFWAGTGWAGNPTWAFDSWGGSGGTLCFVSVGSYASTGEGPSFPLSSGTADEKLSLYVTTGASATSIIGWIGAAG